LVTLFFGLKGEESIRTRNGMAKKNRGRPPTRARGGKAGFVIHDPEGRKIQFKGGGKIRGNNESRG